MDASLLSRSSGDTIWFWRPVTWRDENLFSPAEFDSPRSRPSAKCYFSWQKCYFSSRVFRYKRQFEKRIPNAATSGVPNLKCRVGTPLGCQTPIQGGLSDSFPGSKVNKNSKFGAPQRLSQIQILINYNGSVSDQLGLTEGIGPEQGWKPPNCDHVNYRLQLCCLNNVK